MTSAVMFITCVCVCLCVWPTPPHPTHQAGDFPPSASAMNIRCFLTSLGPEDPLPYTEFLLPPTPPFIAQNHSETEREHKEKQRE